VIASTKTKNPPVDVAMLTNYFQSRVRAVQVIPYDEHLAVGGLIDLDQLNRKTRSAFLELAAAVVDRFAVPTQPRAWPQPQPQQPQPQQAPAPQHVQPQPQWPTQQPAYPGHLQTPYEQWPIPPVQSGPTYPHTGMHPDSPMGPGLPYGPR